MADEDGERVAGAQDPSGSGPDADAPWWLRALAPLRSEAAMFRVLLWTVAICGAIILLTILGRAVL